MVVQKKKNTRKPPKPKHLVAPLRIDNNVTKRSIVNRDIVKHMPKQTVTFIELQNISSVTYKVKEFLKSALWK